MEAVVRALEEDAQIETVVLPAPEAGASLASGKLDLLVLLPQREGEPLVYRWDPTRAEGRAARLAADAAIQRGAGRVDVIEAVDQHTREPGGRYIDFLVPGLVGLNIMGSAVWGIGFSVVDARKRKLLERLAATPMSRAHFLLSYMLSRLAFLIVEIVVLVGFGWLVFDVEVRGSLLALAVVSVWGSLAFTGMALLIAARPTSTEVASGWANLFMLPMWLLSGAFFSYERFPDLTLPFIRALPLTALNDALRAVVNQGQGLTGVGPELAVLGAWGLVGFAVALRVFRWQ